MIDVPKSSSGKESIGEGSSAPAIIKNEALASRQTMLAASKVLEKVAQDYPEIQPYLNLMQFSEATMLGAAGVYTYSTSDNSSDRIIINRTVLGRPGSNTRGGTVSSTLEGITAHEIGHAISIKTQASYKDTKSAVQAAHRQYNRSVSKGERLTEAGFARTISTYAATNYHEAFAEAFTDVYINGNNASRASKLTIRNWRKGK